VLRKVLQSIHRTELKLVSVNCRNRRIICHLWPYMALSVIGAQFFLDAEAVFGRAAHHSIGYSGRSRRGFPTAATFLCHRHHVHERGFAGKPRYAMCDVAHICQLIVGTTASK
jgi:hypothetical protein